MLGARSTINSTSELAADERVNVDPRIMVYERMQTLAESINSWSSECEPIHVSAAPVGSTPKLVYLQKLKLATRPETPKSDWHISSPKAEKQLEPNCSGWNSRLGSLRAPHELQASLANSTQNTIREQRFRNVKESFQPTTNARSQLRGPEEGSRLRELERFQKASGAA